MMPRATCGREKATTESRDSTSLPGRSTRSVKPKDRSGKLWLQLHRGQAADDHQVGVEFPAEASRPRDAD